MMKVMEEASVSYEFFSYMKRWDVYGVDKLCCFNGALVMLYYFVVTEYFSKMRDLFRSKPALQD
jgi:hypothetical protein